MENNLTNLKNNKTSIKVVDAPTGVTIIKKVAVLLVLNFVLFISTIILLRNISDKSVEIKRGRSLKVGASDIKNKFLLADLESHKNQAEKLENLFPDDTKLINFVREIDLLKKEGVISSFSFASENVVNDRTGYPGLPVIIEFKGSLEKVDGAMRKIQNLPFIIRSVTVDLRRLPDNTIVLKYGSFLYVDEKFNQN